MGTITSANANVAIIIPAVFPGQTLYLQGFAADDAFAHDSFDMTETRMGVDGKLSAGFTPQEKMFHITFQADSPSIQVFDLWGLAQEVAREALGASMTVTLPSVNKAYSFQTGWLKGFKKLPDAKKVLDPQTYTLGWESIQPIPI